MQTDEVLYMICFLLFLCFWKACNGKESHVTSILSWLVLVIYFFKKNNSSYFFNALVKMYL